MTWLALMVRLVLFASCGMGGCLIGSQTSFTYGSWIGAGGGLCFALLALSAERFFKRTPLKTVLGGTIGLLAGLLIAELVGFGLAGVANSTARIAGYILLYCFFGYIGMVVGGSKIDELTWSNRFGSNRHHRSLTAKVLDTSVIIDGRVADIVETGFLDGELIIPEFVLRELQHIADSSDPTRRARGRRGLDILRRLQKTQRVKVRIDREDFTDINEVDAKLVALALKRNAQIVTNDYNLAKVAEVQGVRILNINKLANALKPVVLPGEVLRLQILRPGKEEGQGIAYLEDGTMVVVENAGKFLGHEVDAAVTGILQTTAGRMIFTTLKDVERERRH